MEDILDIYEQTYNPKHPVLCFDERPCQLIGDAIIPIPIKPGSPKKEHYEYVRNGTCCIFMAFEPHKGKRFVRIKERRTMVDYANFMSFLASQYPDAETIILVQDNLNTHTAGSFYEAQPPSDAFELAKRFEYHYTPKKEWTEPLRVDNELSNADSWRETYGKNEATLRPRIQDISSSRA